jgi:hypothetical protein
MTRNGIRRVGGRNNPLVDLTGWPYSTFLIYHRWMAYVCILQAIIHSIIYFIEHIHVLPHKFTEAYWDFGVLATVSFCPTIPFSALFVRRQYYEFFIDSHIVLVIIGLATWYYHIFFKYRQRLGL